MTNIITENNKPAVMKKHLHTKKFTICLLISNKYKYEIIGILTEPFSRDGPRALLAFL